MTRARTTGSAASDLGSDPVRVSRQLAELTERLIAEVDPRLAAGTVIGVVARAVRAARRDGVPLPQLAGVVEATARASLAGPGSRSLAS
jgi:hypothetical protein